MHVNDMVPNSMELIEENRRLRHMIDSLKEDLRDQFATAALQGLCANPSVIGFSSSCGWAPVNCTREQVAQYAFGMADDAMKARKEAQ